VKLEELTKEELIWLIRRERLFSQPTERDILTARWERLTKEANDTMKDAAEEQKKYVGRTDGESWKLWMESQEWFDKGMKQSDEAQKVFEQMMAAPK
jgi:hypothetical protein